MILVALTSLFREQFNPELGRWRGRAPRHGDGEDKLRFEVGVTCSVLVSVLFNSQFRFVIGRYFSNMDRYFRRTNLAGPKKGQLFLYRGY